MTRIRRERLVRIVSPILLILLWEAFSRGGAIDARFFPPPSAVLNALSELAMNGSLWADLYATTYRVFWGFVLGAIPGIAIGLAMGLNRWVRVAFDPLIAITYPIPKSALLPLLLLIFGIGETSKIALLVVGVFFPVVINTVAGVLQIDRIYFDVGSNFQANRWQVIRSIAIPGALPTIVAGLRLGAGLALILVYIAELVGAKAGIGYMMWNAWQIFAVERMYVGLIVIGVMGFIISLGFDLFERRLVPWRSNH